MAESRISIGGVAGRQQLCRWKAAAVSTRRTHWATSIRVCGVIAGSQQEAACRVEEGVGTYRNQPGSALPPQMSTPTRSCGPGTYRPDVSAARAPTPPGSATSRSDLQIRACASWISASLSESTFSTYRCATSNARAPTSGAPRALAAMPVGTILLGCPALIAAASEAVPSDSTPIRVVSPDVL